MNNPLFGLRLVGILYQFSILCLGYFVVLSVAYFLPSNSANFHFILCYFSGRIRCWIVSRAPRVPPTVPTAARAVTPKRWRVRCVHLYIFFLPRMCELVFERSGLELGTARQLTKQAKAADGPATDLQGSTRTAEQVCQAGPASTLGDVVKLGFGESDCSKRQLPFFVFTLSNFWLGPQCFDSN